MRCAFLFTIVVVLFTASVASSEESDGWVSLFNGKDFSGWRVVGGEKWSVENGCIVAERGVGEHGWLVTEREYADFELELKFKPELPCNSGIQFRSRFVDGKMTGYQADLATDEPDVTGAFYEINGRGWLTHPVPNVDSSVKSDEWNTYRIKAVGAHIELEVNGVKTCDSHDNVGVEGIIALQIHRGKAPFRMLWKDIRIRDLGYGSGSVPLFNGKDLSGWHEVLGGKWPVEDGCIIGETCDGRYGWLVTDKMYSDFVLDLDFKTEAPGNSGVQIRSHVIKEGRRHDADKMRGYQAEVSPQRGHDTGGVWDEAGDRGWLGRPPRELDNVLREGEWNHYRISMIGDHTVTYLNGVKMVDFQDDRTIRGYIALQVHSGQTPVRVRWKNIRMQDLGYGPGWTPLFNGKDLTGWQPMGKEKWVVEKGAIVGVCVTDKYGYLATEKRYKDFIVRIKFQCGGGNSGLFFHSTFDEKGELRGGVQSEIARPDDSHLDGQLYSGRWLTDIKKATYGLVKSDGWNDMQVTCKGNRIITHVNGFRVADYTDPNPKYTEGVIALQLHSGGETKVKFKDIYIKEL